MRTRSPILKGLSRKIATAPTDCATVSWAARPSARPPIDRPASALPIRMFKLSAVNRAAMITIKTLASLLIRGSY